MLTDSRTIKTWNVRKNDFWTLEKGIRIRDIVSTIAFYINEGYELVDGPTSGTIDLTALTISGRKALVIWRDIPTGTVTIHPTNTMQDSGGALDNVVILGVQLDSKNRPENPTFYSTQHTFALTVGNYNRKLKIEYLNAEIRPSATFSTVTGVFFNHNLLEFNVTYANNVRFEDGGWIDNKLIFSNSGGSAPNCINLWCDNYDISFSDNWVGRETAPTGDWLGVLFYSGYGTDTSKGITVSNSYFHNIGFGAGAGQVVFYNIDPLVSGTAQLIIKNTLLDSVNGGFSGVSLADNVNYVLQKNFTLTFGTAEDYILKDWSGQIYQGKIFSGKDILNFSAILDTNNYINHPAPITEKRESFRGTLGIIKRQFLNRSYQPNKPIDDDLKYFDDDDYNIDWREEEDDVLVNDSGGARKIKNLVLFENDGTTLFDYRNDQNFLLIAQDASSNYAVFAWYKGRLHETVFTDVWADTLYTIQMCIQILRPPNTVNLRNTLPMANSPLTGSLSYQDQTSIVHIP